MESELRQGGKEGEKISNVDHPSHYNISGRKECIVEMLEKFGVEAVKTFCVLNAYKYRYRHELKGGEEDLQKAEWYESYASKLTTQSLPDRMQNALRHIETAVDVDEWAVKAVKDGLEKLDKVEKLAEQFKLQERIAMGVSDEFENHLYMVL